MLIPEIGSIEHEFVDRDAGRLPRPVATSGRTSRRPQVEGGSADWHGDESTDASQIKIFVMTIEGPANKLNRVPVRDMSSLLVIQAKYCRVR